MQNFDMTGLPLLEVQRKPDWCCINKTRNCKVLNTSNMQKTWSQQRNSN